MDNNFIEKQNQILLNRLRFKIFFSVFMIPQRYILGIMGFLAVVNAYIMRVILSVAITEMVESRPRTLDYNVTSSCVFETPNATVLSVKVMKYLFSKFNLVFKCTGYSVEIYELLCFIIFKMNVDSVIKPIGLFYYSNFA